MGTGLPNSVITPSSYLQTTSSTYRSGSIRRSRSETPQPAGYPEYQKTSLKRGDLHGRELYDSMEGRHLQDSGTRSRGRSQSLLRESDPSRGNSGQHAHAPVNVTQKGSFAYPNVFDSVRLKRTTPVGPDTNPGQKEQSTQKINELMLLNAKWEIEVKTLKDQLYQTVQECQLHIQEKSRLQMTIDRQNKTIDELRGKLDRRDKRLGQYKDHLRNKESEVRQLYGDIDRTRRKVDDLQTELDSTNGKLERLNHLLSQRTDELKMVDSYISRTNTHSDVELKKMVEMLNQEISQTSSTIIDSFDFGARVPIRIGRTQEKGILYGLGNGLPLKFLKYLSKHQTTSEDITEDLAVALAVQAVIAKCAFDFAWSWCPSNSELDNYLEDIYQGLCSTDPLTAPRWRAMTRSQIRKDESAEEVKFCRSCLDSRLELLLKVCGWTPDYIKQNQRHAEAIDHGLSVIVSKALNLNKALLEGTIQGGAKPLWFEGRSVFNPNHADDSFSRPVLGRSGEDTLSQPPACKVLCTTDLGLQITTTRSDQTVVATVLKAKIILEDTLFGNVVDDTGRA